MVSSVAYRWSALQLFAEWSLPPVAESRIYGLCLFVNDGFTANGIIGAIGYAMKEADKNDF